MKGREEEGGWRRYVMYEFKWLYFDDTDNNGIDMYNTLPPDTHTHTHTHTQRERKDHQPNLSSLVYEQQNEKKRK